MLGELEDLEKRKVELELSPKELVVSPKVLVSRDDINSSITAVLDTADDKDRAVIARGFISRTTGMRSHKVLTGEVMINLPGLDEFTVPL